MLKNPRGDDLYTMPEQDPRPPEGVLLVDPTEERAQKIGKAISSRLASEILQHVSRGPVTLSRVSELLQVPMNTAKYHVENLLAADLLEVVDTRYSVKGREVKVYGLKNQVLIVAPKKTDLRALLMQYASVFGIAVLAAVVLVLIQPFFTVPSAPPPLLQAPTPDQAPLGLGVASTEGIEPFYSLQAVGAFLLGAFFIIGISLIREWRRIRKT